jgi:DNA-directed RNA polymerase specialized sigma24 family protein
VEQFRPASVIEADTVLAEALQAGDVTALRTLVGTYGSPVVSLLAFAASEGEPSEDSHAADAAIDVFVQAWQESGSIEPGDDFAPWLSSIAVHRASGLRSALPPQGASDRRWMVAAATGAIESESAERLRAVHVEGTELTEDLARHELRLQRRLSHVAEGPELDALLADPVAWVRADDGLADQVVAVVAAEAPVLPGPEAEEPSFVARNLRPVFLGLAGALAVLITAIVALSIASGTPEPAAFSADLIPTGLIVEVDGGEITITDRDAGLEIELDAFTLPRRSGGQFYEGVLVLADGNELSVGTFSEGFEVTLWGGVALDRVETFRVVVREIGVQPSGNEVVLKADFPRL